MIRYGKNTNEKSLGISYHLNNMNVPIHWHSFYEIELCIDGEGIQYINGVPGKYERGVVTFLSPRDFHRIEPTKGHIDILNMYFYSYLLTPDMIDIISLNDPPFCVKLDEDELMVMIDDIKRLEAEGNVEDHFKDRSIKYRVGTICIEIIRKALKIRNSGEEPSLSIKENKTFNMIVHDAIPYINEHLSDPPTRVEMAKRLYLNPTYFSETFKNRFGISYSEYVINARMAEAMRLLRYTDKTVMQVMSDIGYHSPTAFYKQFNECFGIRPGDARSHGYE